MKDLSPEARELIESHRSARSLTQADRSRMKQKLMLQVSTLGATTAVAGTAAGMSLASKVVLVALGVTGMVGAGVVSVRALRSRAVSEKAPIAMLSRAGSHVVAAPAPEESPTMGPRIAAAPESASPLRPKAVSPRHTPVPGRAPVAHPAFVARSRQATPPRVVRAQTLAASVDPSNGDRATATEERPTVAAPETPTPVQKPTPVPAAAPVALPDPEPELQAVREARDDLRAGRPASAYRRLEALDRRSREGMLVQERGALAAIALCQSQPGPVAQARAADFLQRSPESPLATRVRAACEQSRSAVR